MGDAEVDVGCFDGINSVGAELSSCIGLLVGLDRIVGGGLRIGFGVGTDDSLLVPVGDDVSTSSVLGLLVVGDLLSSTLLGCKVGDLLSSLEGDMLSFEGDFVSPIIGCKVG